ncbi:MAG: hypothetical protein AAGF58_00945, partial [Pseudomonadota bacterium]
MLKLLLGGLMMVVLNSAVLAQEQAPVPSLSANLTQAEFQEMLGRLSDEQVRDILIAEFAARRVAPAEESGGILINAQDVGERLSTNAAALLAKWPELGDAFEAVGTRLQAAGGFSLALFALAVSLAAGFIVRYFWRRKAA